MAIGKNAVTNFNPRSHERSDVTASTYDKCWNISIHAPTRGATDYVGIERLVCLVISIHAPTRGATKLILQIMSLLQFQSTLPREERQNDHFPESGRH